jgi:hypothetical protein
MLWGKLTEAYAEAVMGYNNSKANLSWGNYKSRGWNSPNLVTYAESHDEERVMFFALSYGNASGSYNVKNLNTSLKRVAAYHALLLPLRGPKMMWQGGELGYEVSINTNGRTGNKPFRWEYLNVPERVAVLNQVGKLARLKQHVSFSSDSYTYDVAATGKILKVNHDSMNTVIAGNFDVVALNLKPGFQHTGWWYNYITGDSIQVTDVTQTISLQPGDYVVFTDKNLNPYVSPTVGYSELNSSYTTHIFPNPAHNSVFIQSVKNPIKHIEVIDYTGKGILQLDVNSAEVELYTSEWPAGIYMVRLTTGQSTEVKKIIITH